MGDAGTPVPKKKPVPPWLNSSTWHSPARHSPPNFSLNNATSSETVNMIVQNTHERLENSIAADNNEDSKKDPMLRQSRSSLLSNDGKITDNEKMVSQEEGKMSKAISSLPHNGSAGDTWQEDAARLALERKVAKFYSQLAQQNIPMAELRRLVMSGIPNEGSLRATSWKVLLGYLPAKSDAWESEANKRREEYFQFTRELIINPSEVSRERRREEEDEESDHPLSQAPRSVWNQYFKDAEVAEQIERDVKRTHPDRPFFSGGHKGSENVQEAMKRILFVYAKLNPGIRYVQGMNEVLAPLYFVFATDPDPEASVHAEPDAFYCFTTLLSDFQSHYCQQLDNSMVGIRSTIARMAGILRTHDAQLWRHLELVSKVNPQFYSFRWITLLLTQDFEFDNILRIWDSLLANPDGPLEILLRICCAMLICVREKLLAGDFSLNLKLLQKYPNTDVERIIQVAERLKS